MPTMAPSNEVPDPEWPNTAGEFAGYSVMPGENVFDLPPYVRVWNGTVAVYTDLDATSITYYGDNNGLEAFLASQFEEGPVPPRPTLTGWALIGLGGALLVGVLIVFGRRRTVTGADGQ